MLAETGTGVACQFQHAAGVRHCQIRRCGSPASRWGSRWTGRLQRANDLLLEARMAMLLQRVAQGASAFTVLEALELATLGSTNGDRARLPGSTGAGRAADFIGVRLDRLELAGGPSDPAAAAVVHPTGWTSR
jgi:hypothetical protein